MPPHRYTARRRTPRQVAADARADRIAAFLGRALKHGRLQADSTQTMSASVAGISQSCWSDLERGNAANVSLRVWMRAADAVGSDLRAFLEQLPGAEHSRDAVHLRHQELVAAHAARGGWRVMPEHGLDTAGVADLLLARGAERALIEIWNWIPDVGDAFRTWDRKLERLRSTAAGAVSGCWVMRATRRNRDLVATHSTLFAARFPGSGRGWLAAMSRPDVPMPTAPAIVWVSVDGTRLFPARTPASRR